MILIERKKLANQVEVAFFDLSRPLAGDRWRLELRCQATVPVRAEWRGEAPEIAAASGEQLTFTTSKARHFVDQGEKAVLMAELQREMEATLLPYLASPAFPLRLWQRAVADWQKQPPRPALTATGEEPEDDGPADFSALFAAPVDRLCP